MISTLRENTGEWKQKPRYETVLNLEFRGINSGLTINAVS
jgi:hypothetical protein